MHLRKYRAAATIVGLGLVTSMTATPANAAIFTTNCGIITCSVYLTRNTTKEICERLCQYSNASNAAIATAAAAACLPLGGVGAVACGGAGAILGGFFIDKLNQATDANQCLRIRYTKGSAAIPTGLYVDRSKYCKN